jgi:hypothetical protein
MEIAKQEMAALDSNLFTIYLNGLSKNNYNLDLVLKWAPFGSDILKFVMQINLFNYYYCCYTWTFIRYQQCDLYKLIEKLPPILSQKNEVNFSATHRNIGNMDMF